MERSYGEEICDKKGISESVEEVDRRVKYGQAEVKEDYRRTNQRKKEGQFLQLVMTNIDELKDISTAI